LSNFDVLCKMSVEADGQRDGVRMERRREFLLAEFRGQNPLYTPILTNVPNDVTCILTLLFHMVVQRRVFGVVGLVITPFVQI